jgi:hypothetical protein
MQIESRRKIMIRRAFVQASLVVGVMFWFITSRVHAQNCPEGMVPEGGQGVASCAPAGNSSQPQGHWVSQWGAVATDMPHHSGGASLNQPTEEQAKQAALDNCAANGGVDCKIAITYANMCVALTAGDTGFNTSRADTIDKAVQMGMKTCKDAGDTNCSARYTSCSKAKWVQ